jgi:hypothetical protein
MPTYGKENFKESNVNYLNKDFGALKQSLMNYAKSYFPNTYRDFNETSPGMMLLEMNAYVGDVLSFYVDQQYRELLLPLAEERKNIITMAKMFGYKVKPIVPSYVDLTFTSEVDALDANRSKVDYSTAGIFDAGIEIVSNTNSDIIFSTLEPIDFRISASNDTETIGSETAAGLAETYTLSRTVRAVSATEKTLSVQVGIPEKFKTITIPDKNVVDIISCVDSNGQNWYEVDFLAQDKVPISTHYTDDANRDSAYVDDSNLPSATAVPYSLTYITTPKRFTRETNQDDTTSLIFGNGVLKNGETIDEGFLDLEQAGVIVPGQANDLNDSINPLLGDEYSTLGETPNQTTLTITYRVGGGINSNVSSADITTTPTLSAENGNTSAILTSVTNDTPARGGKNQEDTLEIKEKAKAFFTTQNRCVTKEDFEARVLNIPAKFGNIAKAYATREESIIPSGTGTYNETVNYVAQSNEALEIIQNSIDNLVNYLNSQDVGGLASDVIGNDIEAIKNRINNSLLAMGVAIADVPTEPDLTDLIRELELGTIRIYLLGYNNLKQLVGNPHTNTTFTNDNLPSTLLSNIKNYLDNFKMLTDLIVLYDGYIVNFGVIFDVIAEKYADKQKVKLDCIEKIREYFRVEKMQFNQPIYKSNLEFELMGVEGVRSIGHVTITQKDDYNTDSADANLSNATYTYSFNSNIAGNVDIDGNGENDGMFVDATISGGGGTAGYGYKYDFQNALSTDGTIILPPNTATPTVFELKNPNENIQGRVR